MSIASWIEACVHVHIQMLSHPACSQSRQEAPAVKHAVCAVSYRVFCRMGGSSAPSHGHVARHQLDVDALHRPPAPAVTNTFTRHDATGITAVLDRQFMFVLCLHGLASECVLYNSANGV
jgi:hypothetical protein